jgi:cytochrome b6-f complex iron-sulfur subunit
VDRRHFVNVTGGLLAAGFLEGCAALVATPVTPVEGKIRLSVRNYPALSDPSGNLKLQPAGSSTPIYLLVQPDGTVAAFSPVCTHLQCTVNLGRDGMVCPCHGSTYDRAGKVLKGPAVQPLARFPTVLGSDGVLTIDVGGGK